MSFSIEFADDMQQYQARIKVIGCGGAGGNALNTMIQYGLEGVEFIAVNTDAQALNANLAPIKIAIGQGVTKGLGAGADPERGRKAAMEDSNRLKEVIQGADMVFVTAGMGGGTGTGAAPIVAQLAREMDVLTVGVVTKPFFFEGRQRARRAEDGLKALSDHVDTLITIPNQKLMTLSNEDLTFIDGCRKADEVLFQAVQGISDLITQEGIVNVDFADVRTVMNKMGRALMGTGCARGEGRARIAAEQAITSPLLDDISVDGATGVLINIVGGPDMKMREIQEAASLIQEQAHEDANIIFGASIDPSLAEMIKVTVIATGFDRTKEEPHELLRQASRQPLEDAEPQREAPALTYRSPAIGRERQVISHVPAAYTRRPAATALQSSSVAPAPASYQAPASAPQVRSSIRFPATSDADWDVPTYQRRTNGG